MSDSVKNKTSRFSKVLSVTNSVLIDKIGKNLILKKLSRELSLTQITKNYGEEKIKQPTNG